MVEIEKSVEVAKGISDFGMMAVTSAFFLIISSVLLIFFAKWLIKVVNGILDNQNETLRQLLEENREQTQALTRISESSTETNLMKIKAISSFAFDLSIEQVCRIVKKIRVENNIADKEATKEKIKRLLQNLHNDRNTKLDNFTYSGNPLSYYVSEHWIDDIAEVVKKEVYADTENNGRLYSNVRMAYDSIKIEFYKNLRTI